MIQNKFSANLEKVVSSSVLSASEIEVEQITSYLARLLNILKRTIVLVPGYKWEMDIEFNVGDVSNGYVTFSIVNANLSTSVYRFRQRLLDIPTVVKDVSSMEWFAAGIITMIEHTMEQDKINLKL